MKIKKLHLILIIFLGAILRFIGLGTRPFDGDEGIILIIANNPLNELISRASQDVHPPLFHLLTKVFIDFFGISEWVGRLLPAILGSCFVYLVYLIVKKMFNKNDLALFVALLSAFSSYLIYPSQEIRMYMLFAVLGALSYYYFWILLSDNKIKLLSRYWFGYIFCSALMIYSQYLGFVVIFSQLCYLVYLLIKDKSFNTKKTIFNWVLIWVLIIVLFIPQIPILIAQFFARVSEQSQALSIGTNVKGLIGAFYRMGSGRLFLDLTPSAIKDLLTTNPWMFIGFLITLIVPTVLFIKGLIICYKKYKTQFWFFVIPIIIAILLAIISSEIGGRANRYLIYLFPFYIIFIGLASLDYIKSKWWKVVPIVFVLINIIGLYYHYQIENKAPGVNTIANYIDKNYQQGDAVLIRGGFGGGEEWVFRYYWDKLQVTNYKLQVYDMLGGYEAGNLAELKAINPQDKANELLTSFQRIWFYDMTYSNISIKGKEHNLGKDKEGKGLILWEINK